MRVADFGPLKLKAFRESLLLERDEKGGRLSRKYINDIIAQVRAILNWGASEELVPTVSLRERRKVQAVLRVA